MENKQSIEELSMPGVGKSLGTFIKNIFTSADDSVIKYASAELSTLINRLAKAKQLTGNKTITLTFIRNSSEYKKSLDTLGQDTAKKLYKKSFKELTDAQKTEVVKQTTKKLDEVIEKQLSTTGKMMSDDLLKGTTKGKTLITKQSRLAKIQRELSLLKGQNKTAVNNLISKNLTLIGDAKQGAKILDKIKNNEITFVKNGEFYKIAKTNATNRPLKLFKLDRKVITQLTMGGLAGGTIVYLIAQQFPNDEVAAVDENGNDIADETQNTDFPACVNQLIQSGEGSVVKLSDGSSAIQVITNNYPKGLFFYAKGRVKDSATGKMGSYSCKGSTPSLTESKKLSLFNILIEQIKDIDEVASQPITDDVLAADVEEMIDLLDFPVRTQNLIDAHTLLTKYVNNGKVKEFLDLYKDSGFGSGNLGKSIEYVAAFDADTVIAKKKLKKLYDEVISGKATSSSTTPKPVTGGSSIDNINISWDSSGGGQGGGSTGGGQSSGSRPIPPELVDAQGVMAFQNWLDRKTVRWHKKYGKLYGDKSKGYGIYGPNTSKAWEDYGYMYMKELENANRTSQNDALSTNDITPDVMRKSSADYQAATGSRPGFGSISTA